MSHEAITIAPTTMWISKTPAANGKRPTATTTALRNVWITLFANRA